ncbi:unnamed protein product [Soboliphyme baturini]|uniref:Ovule protein n=1 Tax=Soboliphyme baturini TaxID=241478 RepID=A0A183IGB5_9BILA|nr:unnamed protein product [Soboliphyme baturini]
MESEDWFFNSITNYITPGKTAITAALEPRPIFTLPQSHTVYLPSSWPVLMRNSAFFPQYLLQSHFEK